MFKNNDDGSKGGESMELENNVNRSTNFNPRNAVNINNKIIIYFGKFFKVIWVDIRKELEFLIELSLKF